MPEFPSPAFSPGPRGFSCYRSDDGRVVTATVAGELDMTNSPRLDDTLRGADDDAVIVLDLRGLEFIDATGMHVILDAHDRIRAAGGRLLVVQGPSPVQRLFSLARGARALELVDARGHRSAVRPEPARAV